MTGRWEGVGLSAYGLWLAVRKGRGQEGLAAAQSAAIR